jgi:transposase-like protein
MRLYTIAFKRKVIQEVLSGVPKETLRLKYNIRGKSSILNWMRKLGYAEPAPEPEEVLVMAAEQDSLTPAELQKKIKQLERALEDEKLRSEGYRRMIDKAEEQLKINIRKKSGTK